MQLVQVMMSAWRNIMSQILLPVQKHLLPTPLQKTPVAVLAARVFGTVFSFRWKHIQTPSNPHQRLFSILFAPLPYPKNFKLKLLRLQEFIYVEVQNSFQSLSLRVVMTTACTTKQTLYKYSPIDVLRFHFVQQILGYYQYMICDAKMPYGPQNAGMRRSNGSIWLQTGTLTSMAH